MPYISPLPLNTYRVSAQASKLPQPPWADAQQLAASLAMTLTQLPNGEVEVFDPEHGHMGGRFESVDHMWGAWMTLAALVMTRAMRSKAVLDAWTAEKDEAGRIAIELWAASYKHSKHSGPFSESVKAKLKSVMPVERLPGGWTTVMAAQYRAQMRGANFGEMLEKLLADERVRLFSSAIPEVHPDAPQPTTVKIHL